MLSEECQEASHKYFKRSRNRFSRQTSRKDNLSDIFHRFLIFSDPFVRNFLEKTIKAIFSIGFWLKEDLPEAVRNLMVTNTEENKQAEESGFDLF